MTPAEFDLIKAALNTLWLLGVEHSFTTGTLLGLNQLRAFDTNDDAELLEVELMGTTASMARILD